MPSFYFLWNPSKSRPGLTEELLDVAQQLAAGKPARGWKWSTGARKNTDLPPGSGAFLVRAGKGIEPRGVIGYGTIPKGKIYEQPHYVDPSKDATYVDIDWEQVVDWERNPEKVVSLSFLKAAGFGYPVWNPQGNATEIPDEAGALIKARFDARQGVSAPTIEELLELDPDLETKDLAAPEGRQLMKNHLVRERNPALVKKKKRAVLNTTGRLTCQVCTFDFFETYGQLGKDFAECHHIVPLSQLPKVSLTSLDQLAIVCANCHRMLHRGNPWKTIAELKAIVLAYRQN